MGGIGGPDGLLCGGDWFNRRADGRSFVLVVGLSLCPLLWEWESRSLGSEMDGQDPMGWWLVLWQWDQGRD